MYLHLISASFCLKPIKDILDWMRERRKQLIHSNVAIAFKPKGRYTSS